MLVRSSYSSNIKERRDCSCALFDAAGAHGRAGGAHPGPPRGDARGRARRDARAIPRRATSSSSTTRSRGGTHLPDITLVTPLSAVGDDRRLHRHPRAPLGRRRHDAGIDAERLAHDLPGGAHHPADPARPRRRSSSTTCWSSSSRTSALRTIRRADLLRPARGELASAPSGSRELVDRHGLAFVRSAFDDVIAYSERRTRDAPPRRSRTGRYTADDRGRGRRRRRRRHPDPRRGHDRRRPDARRLRRHSGPRRGQRQLPACRHPLRVPVRAARAAARPTCRPTRASRAPLELRRPTPLARQRASSVRRSSPATSRRASASPTSSSPRSRRRSTCPPPGRGR